MNTQNMEQQIVALEKENTTLKANFVRYNLEIRKWWWSLKQNKAIDLECDMESFMREQSIPLEKPNL